MRRVRVIPLLLIQNGGLVKSVKFKNHKYVGDPLNAVKIFNEKEVDEIVLLDISATAQKRPPNISFIKEIAAEAFMPLGYGGGITKASEIQQLIAAGIEKVILNTAAFTKPDIISEGAKGAGSQSIVVSIDVRKDFWGKYKVFIKNGSVDTKLGPVEFAKRVEQLGAGEILLNSIDRDGTFAGYDVDLIKLVSYQVKVPVIAVGGAGKIENFADAINTGASAVSAGSMFVFQGPHRAVLISYPSQSLLKEKVFTNV